MKRILSIITLSMFLMFVSGTEVKAQKEKGGQVVSAGVGWSLTGGLIKLVFTGEDIKVSPVWNATFDYGLTDNFSIGAAFGYQTFKLFVDNGYYDVANNYITEEVEWKFSRMNLAIRPLFHFGRNDDLDMYTGLRIGMIKWGDSHDSSDPDFEDYYTLTLGFQALFGMRVYFSDMIGMHFEAALGAPYLLEGGISIRL